ncbi:uncharacterized protein LOC101745072 isoform X2 [Bombyx mori]|uniref:Insulin receptor substrate 1 n=2 Tax=Bombyx mori TaxID=7091 RepID=A0A8R2M9C6_BOMMO|nr:uncharacterized protein LOC101745072 isoform X2 [Bombyx mori]
MSGAGAGAVVRQGHLRKLKNMKKKYFVLRAETADCSARLEYYESEKKFRASAAPKRVLPLKSCYNITRRLDLKQKHVIALFTREEQFCVVAENEQELHAWLSAILKQHRSDDASTEPLLPIQRVWQVTVQKKGLGASKNIQGLYNLCLTDKTLTLVKIKSHNNVISDLGIPERVEYSLKNIRRCGDSECFFYMEVGRQTTTGAGELWMLCDDSNIAQSMHSTILLAMRDCAKETEHERDHIVMHKNYEGSNTLPTRRQTYSDGKGRAGLTNEAAGLCVGACIRQCVCAGDDSLPLAPLTPLTPLAPHAENQAPNNPLTDKKENRRALKHTRTISLPSGCPLFQEPPKIAHERTRSEPLTGDEVDRVILEKAVSHSSFKAINGSDAPLKKTQWSRRASTGTGSRLPKLSPAHTKNSTTLRSRCDSMPARACSALDVERPPPRHCDLDGLDIGRDEVEGTEWLRTPRIPEEPDPCDMSKDFMHWHGRSTEESHAVDGYLPMTPGHDLLAGLVSASSGSVCSGTPSTDPRFSEYQLEPATSHIGVESRPPRAYSVGSRPARTAPTEPRHRAYSAGSSARHRSHAAHPALPRASAEDLMELDFSNNSPSNKSSLPHSPPPGAAARQRNTDEYVDMSPRNAGYVEMKPATDGYVEMHASLRAGSATLFPLELDPADGLGPLRELSEEARPPPEPHYVSLANRTHDDAARAEPNTAPIVVAGGGGVPARFTLEEEPAPPAPLNYAALDLEPRPAASAAPPRTYTQIDFVRTCEKLHAADGT